MACSGIAVRMRYRHRQSSVLLQHCCSSTQLSAFIWFRHRCRERWVAELHSYSLRSIYVNRVVCSKCLQFRCGISLQLVELYSFAFYVPLVVLYIYSALDYGLPLSKPRSFPNVRQAARFWGSKVVIGDSGLYDDLRRSSKYSSKFLVFNNIKFAIGRTWKKCT